MDDNEIKSVLVGISKDISYLKERFEDRIVVYDKHLEESQNHRDKITQIEAYQSIMWKFVLAAILAICGAWLKIITSQL